MITVMDLPTVVTDDLTASRFAVLSSHFSGDGPRVVTRPFCHYLTVTCLATPEAIRSQLQDLGDRYMGSGGVGVKNYTHHDLMLSGAVISSAGLNTNGRNAVQLDGSTLDRLGGKATAFINRLRVLPNARATRIDLARDMSGASVVWDVRDAFDDGRYLGRVKTTDRWESKGTETPGRTFYMGATQSQLRLRAYDKRGPTRFEFQLRKKSADHVWRDLMSKGYDAAWASCLKMLGEFRACWWWDLLNDVVGGSKVPREERSSLMGQTIARIRHQLGPTLEMLLASGVDVERELARAVKMTAEKRRQLALWQEEAEADGRRVRPVRTAGSDDQ